MSKMAIIFFFLKWMKIVVSTFSENKSGLPYNNSGMADQKTAATAWARRIFTRHPRFSDLPPSLNITLGRYRRNLTMVHTFPDQQAIKQL